MMTIPISQAKANFLELARQVENRECIVVEKKGEPILVLVPYQEYLNLDRIKQYLAVQDLASILQNSGITADELRRESRRELER